MKTIKLTRDEGGAIRVEGATLIADRPIPHITIEQGEGIYETDRIYVPARLALSLARAIIAEYEGLDANSH